MTIALQKIQENDPKNRHEILFLHISTFGKSKKNKKCGRDRTSTFWKICLALFYSGGPKTLASHRVFIKTEFYDGGILMNFGNLEI